MTIELDKEFDPSYEVIHSREYSLTLMHQLSDSGSAYLLDPMDLLTFTLETTPHRAVWLGLEESESDTFATTPVSRNPSPVPPLVPSQDLSKLESPVPVMKVEPPSPDVHAIPPTTHQILPIPTTTTTTTTRKEPPSPPREKYIATTSTSTKKEVDKGAQVNFIRSHQVALVVCVYVLTVLALYWILKSKKGRTALVYFGALFLFASIAQLVVFFF